MPWRPVVVAAMVAAALVVGCSRSTPPPAPGGGQGAAVTCESARPRVEQLYRAEAEIREPGRVAEAVDDNTTMVLTDCATDPARFTACIAAAATVAELEARCLVPLDEEGSEGDALR